MREEEEGQNSDAGRDRQFANEHEESTHFVGHQQSKRIGNDHFERSTSRREETRAVDRRDDISIAIEQFQEFLQTEQTASTAAEQTSSDATALLFHFLLEIFQNHSNHLHDSDQERPEGDCSEMKERHATDRRNQRRTRKTRSFLVPIVSHVDTG